MDFIRRLHYGRLVGVTLRGDAVLYRFAPVRYYKLDFYALAGTMVENGLLLTGWDERTERTGWDGGFM